MANNRTKFPQHLYMDLSEQNFKIYDKEDNKSGLISKLLEEYYDTSIVKVKIDDKIKDAYANDIFKEFRIPMLLLEFYMKGNIGDIKNEVSISSANPNTAEHINEEVTLIASSENNTEEITDTENQRNIEEVNQDINSSKEHTDETGYNIYDKNTITKVFVVNDDETTKSNEVKEHISSDNKNDIKEEDNSTEITSNINNNTENNNNEVVNDTPKGSEENKTNTKIVESERPRSGSIDDLLKGKNLLKHKKSIL